MIKKEMLKKSIRNKRFAVPSAPLVLQVLSYCCYSPRDLPLVAELRHCRRCAALPGHRCVALNRRVTW